MSKSSDASVFNGCRPEEDCKCIIGRIIMVGYFIYEISILDSGIRIRKGTKVEVA